MRLARYESRGVAKVGVVVGDGVVDLTGVGAGYPTMRSVIDGGAAALAEIAAALGGAPIDATLAEVRLLAPVERPGKYLAIGMNYQKHLEEAARIGVGAPERQLWFNKQTTCLNDPFGIIEPGVTERLDYEVELGVVIGRAAKGVTAAAALDHVFGYLVANDVSARDWQFHTATFTMGKSFDTHGPIGPWIVTADEIADPQALDLRCSVNGEPRQASNTAMMLHPVARQIEYLSTAFTLEPGDLIATGTPEGVGVGMDPPVFLRSGDVVRCEIDGIGAIENSVA